ncbi:MAG: lysozyme inhibitor LprI family protein [Novosphingobium sp.]
MATVEIKEGWCIVVAIGLLHYAAAVRLGKPAGARGVRITVGDAYWDGHRPRRQASARLSRRLWCKPRHDSVRGADHRFGSIGGARIISQASGKPDTWMGVAAMIVRLIVCYVIILMFPGVAVAKPATVDATEVALEQCLALPANASTAGQTDCEVAAMNRYNHRMNVAYAALMRQLPAAAADRLRKSQRAWMAFRYAEAEARGAIFATRQGTMFVPMESDAATVLIGDRARLLERYVRVLGIE